MGDLNLFLEWAKQGPRRSVQISIQGDIVTAMVYDGELGAFQSVRSVTEIDLETIAKQNLAALQTKISRLQDVIHS